LRKISCRMVFSYQTQPTSKSLSCTNFGVNNEYIFTMNIQYNIICFSTMFWTVLESSVGVIQNFYYSLSFTT
jgi:hypothetical protein